MEGLVDEILGHVSARIADTDEMWIRCRSPEEEGVRYTTVEAIRRVDFDGKGPHKGEPYQVPNELPIHGEIYKKRPDVGCVIHAHPKEALICGITELEFRPIFGAFNIHGHAHGAGRHSGISALLSRQPAGACRSYDRNHG